MLDEALAEALDGADAHGVDLGDLLVGPCGAEVGLVGGAQHEGTIDGLRLLAAAAAEVFERGRSSVARQTR